MSKYISFFIIIFSAFTAAAQTSKTRQVDEALGTRIREIPAQGDRIEYAFQIGRREQVYQRTGNGVSEYTTLLQKTSGLADYNDQGGTLLYVKKNGEVVARGSAVGTVAETHQPASRIKYGNEYTPSTTGDPVRPRTMSDVQPIDTETNGFSLPDSLTMAENIESAKREFDYRSSELWQIVKPTWAALMYFFWALVPLFVCIGGIMNYFAGTAANEGFYGLSMVGQMIRRVHEAASGATLVICWAITVVLLINVFMLFVYSGVSLWWMILVWFPCIWIAKRLTNWIVPNPPGVIEFSRQERSSSRAISPY